MHPKSYCGSRPGTILWPPARASRWPKGASRASASDHESYPKQWISSIHWFLGIFLVFFHFQFPLWLPMYFNDFDVQQELTNSCWKSTSLKSLDNHRCFLIYIFHIFPCIFFSAGTNCESTIFEKVCSSPRARSTVSWHPVFHSVWRSWKLVLPPLVRASISKK